jgi:hypothetical protein
MFVALMVAMGAHIVAARVSGDKRVRTRHVVSTLARARFTSVHPVRTPAHAASATLVQERRPPSKRQHAMSGLVRLPGEVIPDLPTSAPSARTTQRDAGQHLTLTLALRRSDQAGFQRFLAAVRNPHSRLYRHYLTQAQLAARFGPTTGVYDSVLNWLRSQGFRLTQGSTDRLSLSVSGTRAQAERAFDTPIRNFHVGSRTVYANSGAPALPHSLGSYVEAITGLSNLAEPTAAPLDQYENPNTDVCLEVIQGKRNPLYFESWANLIAYAPLIYFVEREFEFNEVPAAGTLATTTVALWAFDGYCLGAYVTAALQGYGLIGSGHPGAADRAMYNRSGPPNGRSFSTGDPPTQKIGLLEFDTYRPSDVTDWLKLGAAEPSLASRLSEVSVNGGVSTPGSGESEVLLDIDTVLAGTSLDPQSYAVYDGPPSTGFLRMFQAMIGDGDTVISNSWSQCEDQTPLAEAEAINSVLEQASASGITVVNGAGDHGSSCLDGSPDTVGVPADSPNATAVGGSSPTFGPGLTYGKESWWDDEGANLPGGAGGFGVSRYFSRPSYQAGLTSSSMRSVPDIVADADPSAGIQLCQMDAGGCPDGLLWGGTSMATPEVAAQVAELNVALGHDVGNLNAALYPLNGTNAFHSPASMGSNFAHVGLGAPVMTALLEDLGGSPAGAVSGKVSHAFVIGAPEANGTATGTVEVDLEDTSGLPVGDKEVTLTADPGSHAVISAASGTSTADGAVTFTVTDTRPETVTFTVKDESDGITLTTEPSMTFAAPAATGATIAANPTTVINNGTSKTTIQVYLQNSLGRPASGKTVKLTGGGSAVISPGSDEAVTNSEGIATFTATDTAQESIGFTAVDMTDEELPVPGSAVVNFQPEETPACPDTPPKPTAGSPVSVSSFASDFPDNTQGFEAVYEGIRFTGGACSGIDEPTFDDSGNVYVPDEANGQIYEFGPVGGPADNDTAIADNVPGLQAIAFGKHGELYATLNVGGNPNQPELVQLNAVTGAIERVIATKSTGMFDFPTYMAVDPISGDVFVVDDGGGLGTEHFSVTRVHEPDSASPVIENYGDVEGVQTGIAFAPDGTMYVGVVNGPHENEVLAVSATNSATPGKVTPVIKIPTGYLFGVAVAESNEHGEATALDIINNEGDIYRVNLTEDPATATELAERPSIFTRGGAIGPDGCLYYQDQDTLLKVTGVSSKCASAQGGNAGPQIALSDGGPASPPTGSQTTVTASLANFPDVEGTDVTFLVTGANGQVKLVHAGANGEASFSYSGVFPGIDTIKALASSGEKEIESAPLLIHWTAGKETTFLSLNASQESGPLGQPATLTANLSDISREPATPIAGATVTIGLEGHSCEALTDAEGNASCSITPAGPLGLDAVTATYGGSETYTASTATNVFEAGGVGLETPAGESPPGGGAPPSAPPATTTSTPHTSTLALKKATPPLAEVLGLPSAHKCVSGRELTVHVHAPAGQKLLSVKLTLGKKVLRSIKFVKGNDNKIPSTVVDLKGLPKGTYTLKIVVKTKSGKTYSATRTYHTCVAGKKH